MLKLLNRIFTGISSLPNNDNTKIPSSSICGKKDYEKDLWCPKGYKKIVFIREGYKCDNKIPTLKIYDQCGCFFFFFLSDYMENTHMSEFLKVWMAFLG